MLEISDFIKQIHADDIIYFIFAFLWCWILFLIYDKIDQIKKILEKRGGNNG